MQSDALRILCLAASLWGCEPSEPTAPVGFDAAVTAIGEARIDASVDDGRVRLHERLGKHYANIVGSPPKRLVGLFKHPKPTVRVMAAMALLESHPDQHDEVKPLLADGAKVERQTFDMVSSSTVAEVVVEFICGGAGGAKAQPMLGQTVKDKTAFAGARSASLTCLAEKSPEEAAGLAETALEEKDGAAVQGAIDVVLTSWLKKNGIDGRAFQNGRPDLPAKIEYPDADDALRLVMHAADAREPVRERVGKALAWLPFPDVDEAVAKLAADPREGVRMMTFRTYMYRPKPERKMIELCVEDRDGLVAEQCANDLLLRADLRTTGYEILLRHAKRAPALVASALTEMSVPMAPGPIVLAKLSAKEQEAMLAFLKKVLEELPPLPAEKSFAPQQQALIEAGQAMGELGIPAAKKAWTANLRSPRTELRLAAVESAGANGLTKETVPLLEDLLEKDPEREVKEACLRQFQYSDAVSVIPTIVAARASAGTGTQPYDAALAALREKKARGVKGPSVGAKPKSAAVVKAAPVVAPVKAKGKAKPLSPKAGVVGKKPMPVVKKPTAAGKVKSGVKTPKGAVKKPPVGPGKKAGAKKAP